MSTLKSAPVTNEILGGAYYTPSETKGYFGGEQIPV